MILNIVDPGTGLHGRPTRGSPPGQENYRLDRILDGLMYHSMAYPTASGNTEQFTSYINDRIHQYA
jgi:hypothetical protein